jgi:thiol-disulfide isomerase/thioredoxin
MPTRRIVLAVAVLSLLSLSALAAEKAPFTPKDFSAAQSAGEPILVHISAPWCPTCKAQHPILDKLEKDAKFSKLKVFQVDFDSQKDVVRSLKATSQSTLIVFKGALETGRSVGDTDATSIAALLDKAL